MSSVSLSDWITVGCYAIYAASSPSCTFDVVSVRKRCNFVLMKCARQTNRLHDALAPCLLYCSFGFGVCSMGTAIEISAANLTYKYSTTSPENSFIFGWKVKVTSHKNIAGVGHCNLVCAGFFWLFLLMIMFVCLINENLLMMMLVLGCRAWLHQHRVACRPYEAAWSCLCSWIVSSICLYYSECEAVGMDVCC